MAEPADEELRDFIAEAIKAGWPDNICRRRENDFPGFFDSNYVKKSWRFIDLWSGDSTDMGLQVVFHDEQPKWACTYRGGIITPDFLTANPISSNPTFTFLMTAIRQPADPTFPIRGPQTYEEDGGWEYTFRHSGAIASFLAIESISQHSEQVYERIFIGGRIGGLQLYGDTMQSLIRPLME
jgi:Domain of unknown function (DUF5680)